MADEAKILEQVEEIKQIATEAQSKNEEVLAGKADMETVEKMSLKFAELSESVQKQTQELESEQKSREALELAFARVSENGGDVKALQSDPEYKKGFNDYIRHRKGISEEALNREFETYVKSINPDVSQNEIISLKAMVVGSNPDGGYMAPVGMSTRIIERMFETSPMRTISTVENTSFEAQQYSLDDDEADVENVGEVDTRNITGTPVTGVVEIPTHEIQATPEISQKRLDDAMFNAESWLNKKVSSKIGRQENYQFINGTGVKMARGILDYADWTTPTNFTTKVKGVYQRNALETLTTAGASTIAGDDLVKLQATLLADYNGTWGLNRITWAEILQLKDAVNGNYLLNPAMLFSGSQGLQLLGDPVVMLNDLPTSKDGEIPIVYGDFREGYTILDRIGIRILRDPYSNHGFVQFYTTKRTGGAVTNCQAIKRLKIKAAE